MPDAMSLKTKGYQTWNSETSEENTLNTNTDEPNNGRDGELESINTEHPEVHQQPGAIHGEYDNIKVIDMTVSILHKYETTRETPFKECSSIPKVKKDPKTKEAVKLANEAVQNINDNIGNPMCLMEINQLIYAAAQET